MKKIAVFMMILSCCMFFGCSSKEMPASNEFILLSLSDGGGFVTQSLFFSVGTNKLKSEGMDEEAVSKFKNKLIENVNGFRDEFYLALILSYSANQNPDYQIGKAVLVSETAYHEANDCVGFQIIFTSKAAWQFYHPSSGEQPSPSFGYMITASSSGAFPFAENIPSLNQTVGQRYMSAYTKALEGFEAAYSPDFVYDYASDNRALKADSEYSFEQNGLYHHIWLKGQSEYQDSTITLYISQPNRGLWMLTLVGVAFAGYAVTLLVLKLKKRKS